jgi:hypothetical protein
MITARGPRRAPDPGSSNLSSIFTYSAVKRVLRSVVTHGYRTLSVRSGGQTAESHVVTLGRTA